MKFLGQDDEDKEWMKIKLIAFQQLQISLEKSLNENSLHSGSSFLVGWMVELWKGIPTPTTCPSFAVLQGKRKESTVLSFPPGVLGTVCNLR